MGYTHPEVFFKADGKENPVSKFFSGDHLLKNTISADNTHHGIIRNHP